MYLKPAVFLSTHAFLCPHTSQLLTFSSLSFFHDCFDYLPQTALNWKEKRSLGLDKLQKKKVFRIRPDGYGDPETDLYPFMKPERGDKLIDITDMAEFTLPALEEDEDEEAVDPEDNPRKKIQLSMLYGPTKSAGLMLKKENRDKKRFSHRRIFGEGMDDETWKKISAEKAKKYADCFTRRRRASAQAKNRLWSGVYGM